MLAAGGHPVTLHRCGALHLADQPVAQAVLADHEAVAKRYGTACESTVPLAYAAALPWLNLARFRAALWFPEECHADPYLLASAYGAAARALGVRFQSGTPVRLADAQGQVGIVTPGGLLRPHAVWVAAGAWSTRLLRPLGVVAPQAAVRSQYWITAQTALATPAMPMVLAPDLRLYARADVGAILFGLRETTGVALPSSALPDDLAFVGDLLTTRVTIDPQTGFANYFFQRDGQLYRLGG